MTALKRRCTKGLRHVNSCLNYYYTINLHIEVPPKKIRSIRLIRVRNKFVKFEVSQRHTLYL